MASVRASTGAAEKRFPSQLAIGVLKDLLSKELDAHLFPDDAAKQAAFAAAKDSLQRRLALLTSQVAVVTDIASATEGICSVVRELWELIFNHPSLLAIQPTVLQTSLWLETLTSVLEATCAVSTRHRARLMAGGSLVSAAFGGIDASGRPPESIAHLGALIRWWGDDVCVKRWRVKDAWGPCTTARDKPWGPLHAIADAGFAALVPLAVEKGCPVNGDFSGHSRTSPPALAAFAANHMEVFEALLAHGLDLTRPYEKDGWPVALRLLRLSSGASDVAFIAELLRKRPEIIHASASTTSMSRENFLGAAIASADAALVDLVLSAGAPVEYGCQRTEERGIELYPTMATALMIGQPRILELIITKHSEAVDWKRKYTKKALGCIATRLANLAISAYPPNPHYTGDQDDLMEHNPDAAECLEMVLATGFCCSWDLDGNNSVAAALYPQSWTGAVEGCLLAEAHALATLKRFHAAGFDVLKWRDPGSSIAATPQAPAQLHIAALAVDQPEVLGWCVEVLGVRIDGDSGADLLGRAFQDVALQCALLLLQKYKVRVARPGKPLPEQPLTAFMVNLNRFSDTDAERVMGAVIECEPSLFRAAREGEAVSCRNPVLMCVAFKKPRTLELLLKKSPPGVAAMANWPVLHGTSYCLSAAQLAALTGTWDCLDLLLRYTDSRVTDATRSSLSAADYVAKALAVHHGPPRALQAAVEARASKELADKARAETSRAIGKATNAFEDPSLGPLTASQEKQKAKKKAAKKKARAKKRLAAATANAGAGGAALSGGDAEDDEDSSSDGDSDYDEDVRYAPDFDALKAQMEQANLKKE